MLTPGNKKLGGHLIWGFGLPSGTQSLCQGMTPVCRKVCYAVRMQQFRPQALPPEPISDVEVGVTAAGFMWFTSALFEDAK